MSRKIRWLPPAKPKKFCIFLLCTALIVPIALIPVRVALTRVFVPEPQGIFVLGGDPRRIKFAADFWRTYANKVDIWMSDEGRNLQSNKKLFKIEEVPEQRVHHDSCPTDTVTNFTCIADKFAALKIWHLYLITSEYHMARSRAIATLVFGSRGIIVTPLGVPTPGIRSEAEKRIWRDCVRSVLWILTGRTGASFNPRLPSKSQASIEKLLN